MLTTLASVGEWAGIPGRDFDALLGALGMEAQQHPRVLANVPAPDFEEVLNHWQPHGRPPSPALRSPAGLAGRASRVARGFSPEPRRRPQPGGRPRTQRLGRRRTRRNGRLRLRSRRR